MTTPWRERVARWHSGKLILLWAWGVLLVALSALVVTRLDAHSLLQIVTGLALLLFLVLVPCFLSGITWVWFSGKEESASSRTLCE